MTLEQRFSASVCERTRSRTSTQQQVPVPVSSAPSARSVIHKKSHKHDDGKDKKADKEASSKHHHRFSTPASWHSASGSSDGSDDEDSGRSSVEPLCDGTDASITSARIADDWEDGEEDDDEDDEDEDEDQEDDDDDNDDEEDDATDIEEGTITVPVTYKTATGETKELDLEIDRALHNQGKKQGFAYIGLERYESRVEEIERKKKSTRWMNGWFNRRNPTKYPVVSRKWVVDDRREEGGRWVDVGDDEYLIVVVIDWKKALFVHGRYYAEFDTAEKEYKMQMTLSDLPLQYKLSLGGIQPLKWQPTTTPNTSPEAHVLFGASENGDPLVQNRRGPGGKVGWHGRGKISATRRGEVSVGEPIRVQHERIVARYTPYGVA